MKNQTTDRLIQILKGLAVCVLISSCSPYYSVRTSNVCTQETFTGKNKRKFVKAMNKAYDDREFSCRECRK